eukprot:PITA_19825
MPRGLVPLEILFNSNDVVVSSEKVSEDEHIQDQNIGTRKETKLVKLFKGVPLNYKERYIELFRKYTDVFAWSYEDLKTYDVSIIQHKIPLKEGIKPFKQKLGQINPLLLPLIEKEVKKLLDTKIVVPLRYSDWVVNLVPKVTRSFRMSMLDGFSGYNQVAVDKEDQKKIAFTTPWGTFMYA